MSQQVTVMIVGFPARKLEFNEGELLGGLIERSTCDAFPMHKLDIWYCNQTPVDCTASLKLEAGQIIAGCLRPH